MRVGLGYDIHRLAAGRRLILGGVEFHEGVGLDGHSDADVLVHAIMDALLGAAALGDIGSHFPPTDERFRDVSSIALLGHVEQLVREAGYRVVNVDAVLVAERPKIGPHSAEMRSGVARALHIDVSAVGLKATTNEGMGPEGRYEAMSAHAVALIEETA